MSWCWSSLYNHHSQIVVNCPVTFSDPEILLFAQQEEDKNLELARTIQVLLLLYLKHIYIYIYIHIYIYIYIYIYMYTCIHVFNLFALSPHTQLLFFSSPFSLLLCLYASTWLSFLAGCLTVHLSTLGLNYGRCSNMKIERWPKKKQHWNRKRMVILVISYHVAWCFLTILFITSPLHICTFVFVVHDLGIFSTPLNYPLCT
jgi:hypothetical protein